MQNRILITAIGTINGTAIIRELRKGSDNNYLIGTDIFPANYIVNSREVDEFYQFPKVVDDTEQYIEYIKGFCKDHQIDAIYAVIDEEVLALASHREEFKQLGVAVCEPDLRTVEICHDKARFALWMQENMPDNNIRTYKNINEISEYPVFIKPIHGRASVGCRKVETYKELKDLKLNWNEYVIQEFATGELYAADIIANPQHNQLLVVQRKEHLRNSNGCGMVVEIVNETKINEVCECFAKKMGVEGIINIEFFVSETDIKIIEVNPRLPAGTEFTCMAGGNTVVNALKIANGEKCEWGSINFGAIYARRYETYEMK